MIALYKDIFSKVGLMGGPSMLPNFSFILLTLFF